MSTLPAIDRASRWKTIRREIGRALGALVIALVVTFIVVLLTSKAPFDAITQLLGEGSARAAAIAEGRAAAARVYAPGVVARAYEAIYLRALQRSSAPL